MTIQNDAKKLKKWVFGLWLSVIIILSGVRPAMAARLSTVTSLKVKTSAESVTLTWNKTPGATSYIVYFAKKGEALKKADIVKVTKAVIGDLTPKTTYRFAVAAINSSGTGKRSKTIEASTSADKSSIGSISTLAAYPGNKTVTLKWNTVKNTDYYKVYMKGHSEKTWSLKCETKNKTASIKGLTNGKAYDFAVSTVIRKSEGKKKIVNNVTPIVDSFGTIHSILYSAKTKKSTTLIGLSGQKNQKIKSGTSLTISRTANEGYYTALYKNKYWLVEEKAVRKTNLVISSVSYTEDQAQDYVNARKWTSSTSYLIWVSTFSQKLYVFWQHDGKWLVIRECSCATGKFTSQTPYGKTKISGKQLDWSAYGGGYFASRIAGGAIHSGGMTGTPNSHGCVRLNDVDALWVYCNMPIGTAVYVY